MRFLVTWIVLAVFWMALSGHLDAIHLIFGFVSVTLVAAVSSSSARQRRALAPSANAIPVRSLSRSNMTRLSSR